MNKHIQLKNLTKFIVVLFVCLYLQLIAFGWLCGFLNTEKIWLLFAVADAMFLTMPFIFLSPRWRCTIWLMVTGLTIYLYTNILYIRNFGQFYSSAIFYGGNIIDPMVIRTSIASILRADVAILLPVSILAYFYYVWHKNICHENFGKVIRIAATALFVLLPPMMFCIGTLRLKSDSHTTSFSKSLKMNYLEIRNEARQVCLTQNNGITWLWFRFLTDFSEDKIDISLQDYKSIGELLDGSSHKLNPIYEKSVKMNQDKNLILIIVESLNSTILQLPDSLDITPTLSWLALDSTTIFVPRVLTQTGPGNSSDGQFIYNSGLLPLMDRAFVAQYANSNYPSIPKLLKHYHCVEAIGEGKRVWNHNLTSKSLGYNAIYDQLREGSHEYEDDNIFTNSLTIAKTLHKPFFLNITTISMHSPYEHMDVSVALKNADSLISKYGKHGYIYLERTHALDKALGRFLHGLNELGLLDSTVIAIIGDHAAPTAHLNGVLSSDCVPFIIYNSNIRLKYNHEIGQIDIFPTLIDVMGIPKNYILPQTGKPYYGIGKSILSLDAPTRPTTYSIGTEYQSLPLHELIIRGRYFE